MLSPPGSRQQRGCWILKLFYITNNYFREDGIAVSNATGDKSMHYRPFVFFMRESTELFAVGLGCYLPMKSGVCCIRSTHKWQQHRAVVRAAQHHECVAHLKLADHVCVKKTCSWESSSIVKGGKKWFVFLNHIIVFVCVQSNSLLLIALRSRILSLC